MRTIWTDTEERSNNTSKWTLSFWYLSQNCVYVHWATNNEYEQLQAVTFAIFIPNKIVYHPKQMTKTKNWHIDCQASASLHLCDFSNHLPMTVQSSHSKRQTGFCFFFIFYTVLSEWLELLQLCTFSSSSSFLVILVLLFRFVSYLGLSLFYFLFGVCGIAHNFGSIW